jgi:2-dehydropantoate 2-reductase
VCVKEFDLHSALASLEPIIGDEAIVLPLLNGVDVYSRVRNVLHRGLVLPACVYVGTHIERPGKVSQKGGACKILFGPDPAHPNFVPEEVLGLFQRAEIKSEWTADVQVEIWKKFIFICAYGLVSAAFGKTVGEILQDEALKTDTETIMQEAVALAKASGVSLPSDVVEASLSKAKSFPFETKTSFQRDFERIDKNDERDLFAGSVIRMGHALKIDVPRTKALAAILESRKPTHRRV